MAARSNQLSQLSKPTLAWLCCFVFLLSFIERPLATGEWEIEHTAAGFGGGVRQQITSDGAYTFSYNEGASICTGTLSANVITRIERFALNVLADSTSFVESEDGCTITDGSTYSLSVSASEGRSIRFPSYEHPGNCSYKVYPESVAEVTAELQRLRAAKSRSECFRRLITQPLSIPRHPSSTERAERVPKR